VTNLMNKGAEDARLHSQALSDAARESEKRLAQQEANSNRIIQAEERRATRVEQDLDDAKKELLDVKKDLKDSKKAVAIINDRLAEVQTELEAAKKCVREEQTSSNQIDEVSRLEAKVQDLLGRAKNINERYKQGDLVCIFHSRGFRS
jgi:archaellum component FlaC